MRALGVQVLSGAALYSMWVGEGEALLREAFQRARMASPAILFVDEIDAIVGARRAAPYMGLSHLQACSSTERWSLWVCYGEKRLRVGVSCMVVVQGPGHSLFYCCLLCVFPPWHRFGALLAAILAISAARLLLECISPADVG